MAEERRRESPVWRGWLEIEGPVAAVRRRTGEPLERHGQQYSHGTVWAYDDDGVRAGRQTFDVYEVSKVVLLDEAGLGESDGDNGQDNTGQGGGRAVLNLLEAAYPNLEWWFASSEGADHTQDGIDFMRRREQSGHRKIHTEKCAMQVPRPILPCSCDFQDRAARDTAMRKLGYDID